MREIKFRAYDPDKKCFIHTGFSIIGECTLFDVIRGYSLENTCALIITQYTGLKDKNGNEIYEGDIIEWHKTCYDFDKEDGDEKFIKVIKDEVLFEHGEFKASKSSYGYEGEDLIPLDESIVIGNIYDNIDFLNESYI